MLTRRTASRDLSPTDRCCATQWGPVSVSADAEVTHNQRDMIGGLTFTDGTPLRSFAYNAIGERVIVTDDPSVSPQPAYWAYDGDLLISERNAAGSVFAYYKHNELPSLRKFEGE